MQHPHPQQRRRDARPRPRRLPDAPGRDPGRRPQRARRRLPAHRHRGGLRQRAPGRRGGPRLRHGPLGGLPGDQDLDQRLRIRRDAARLREERPQARRRPDRPADPAPGAAVGVRPDPRGLPRAGDAARRWQGPRHRGQQLHGRAPHEAPRTRDRGAGGQPDRGPPLLPQREVQDFGAEHGILTQAWSPIGGITFYRDGEPQQHPGGPGHRRHRQRPRQVAGPGDAALGPAARPLGHPEVHQAAAASPRTSTSSTSSCPPTSCPRSTAWTPVVAAGPSPRRSPSRRSGARSPRPESSASQGETAAPSESAATNLGAPSS